MGKDVAALENAKGQNQPKPKKKKFNKPASRTAHVPTQMESQLSALYNLTLNKEGHLREIEQLGVEGVDHINISRSSSSKLGVLLSTNTKMIFNLFGRNFSSVENLMIFYRTHCTVSSVATADSNSLFKFRNTDLAKYPHFENIFVVVCLAYHAIFKKYAPLRQALSENTLALDSYKVVKTTRSRISTARILTRAINEAHAAASENRKPNLTIFMKRDDLKVVQEAFDDIPYDEKATINTFIESQFDPAVVSKAYWLANPKPVEEKVAPAAETPAVELGSVVLAADVATFTDIMSSVDNAKVEEPAQVAAENDKDVVQDQEEIPAPQAADES